MSRFKCTNEIYITLIISGLHLNLTEGFPLSPNADVSTLLMADGAMLGKHGFRSAVRHGKIDLKQVTFLNLSAIFITLKRSGANMYIYEWNNMFSGGTGDTCSDPTILHIGWQSAVICRWPHACTCLARWVAYLG